MKVQSINQCNFEGKNITKKSKSGKWWVEYSPYSWENFNNSTAEPRRYIDIFSSTLPNNEQTFKSVYKYNILQREVTSDIFGTTTSIYDAATETRHDDVRKMPSMNREESIQVYIDKLEKFLEMKQEYHKDVKRQIQETYNQIGELSKDFDKHSKDYDNGFFAAKQTKSQNKDSMTLAKEKIMDRISSVQEQERRLEQLNESMNQVKKQIIKLREELDIIKKAKHAGNVIDISRREIYDADRPLWNTLKDMRSIAGKVVVLPHKTISMRKILAQMNQEKLPVTRENIVKHITKLIEFIR